MNLQYKSLRTRFLYAARDLRSQPLFRTLNSHCRGHVLDVGGWDFYLTAQSKKLGHTTWTTLENDAAKMIDSDDKRFKMIIGDGCAMDFQDASFDTVICLQVLEHVFEPIQMFREIARVLKPGGIAIVVVPQTGNLHLQPFHFYNFTKFWLLEATKQCALEKIEYKALGGAWSTLASRLLFMFFQSFNTVGNSYGESRGFLFYVFLPFALLYSLISIPICMLFSLADISEEPNNHMIVVRKSAPQA